MTMTAIPADPTPYPVRVTIDAEARPFGSGDLLRLQYAGGVLVVDPEVDGVEVEHLPEPRTWTDGDVVQHATEGWTLTRTWGEWHHSRPHGVTWQDEQVTECLGERGEAPGWGHLVVLRYQASE